MAIRPLTDIFHRDRIPAKPWRNRASLPAGMRELNGNLLVLAVGEFVSAPQRLDLPIFPQPRIFRRDAALRLYSGGLDKSEAWTTLNYTAYVRQVPVVGITIFRRILAHRREQEAV